MNKETKDFKVSMLKKTFLSSIEKLGKTSFKGGLDNIDVVTYLYYLMFNDYPNHIHPSTRIYLDNANNLDNIREKTRVCDGRQSLYNMYLHREELPLHYMLIDSNNLNSLVFIFNGLIIGIYDTYEESDSLVILTTESDIPEWIEPYIAYKDANMNANNLEFLSYGKHGFESTKIDIKDVVTDIKLQYNDDLPYDDIQHFISNDTSGLCILHGKPGTGKTSLIRHLIAKNEKTNFIYADFSCFSSITDSSFLKFLLAHKGSVIIFEDCEKLLEKRDDGGNSLIQSLLNLSDGILGDGLQLKFICTFNSDITRIDEALLRKGRMKIKYEFNELTSDKTQTLAQSINIEIPKGESLPISDIYNYYVDNDKSQGKKKSIGF